MSRHDGSRESVKIVASPLIVPGRRSAHQRGVGDSPSDHDVRARGQGLHNSEASKVGVRRNKGREVVDRFARLEVGERPGVLKIAQASEKIVAVDVGDFWRKSESIRQVTKGVRARFGVESPSVRNDLDAPIETGTHDLFHLREKRASVSLARVFRLRSRQDQHGEFGEPIARQDVDGTALHHLARGRDSIAVKTRTVSDANHVGSTFSVSGRMVNRAAPLST